MTVVAAETVRLWLAGGLDGTGWFETVWLACWLPERSELGIAGSLAGWRLEVTNWQPGHS